MILRRDKTYASICYLYMAYMWAIRDWRISYPRIGG